LIHRNILHALRLLDIHYLGLDAGVLGASAVVLLLAMIEADINADMEVTDDDADEGLCRSDDGHERDDCRAENSCFQWTFQGNPFSLREIRCL